LDGTSKYPKGLEKVQEGMNREKENDAKIQAMLKDCEHSLATNAAAAQAVKDLGFGRKKIPASVFASSPDEAETKGGEEGVDDDDDFVPSPSLARSAADALLSSFFEEILDEDEAPIDPLVGNDETEDHGSNDGGGEVDGGGGDSGGGAFPPMEQISSMFSPFGLSNSFTSSASPHSADQWLMDIIRSSVAALTEDQSPIATEDLDPAQRDSSPELEEGVPAPTIASVLVAAGIANWRVHAENLVLNGLGVDTIYQAASPGNQMLIGLGMTKYEIKQLRKYAEKNPLERTL
jgi:hypothetical protein